MNGVKSYIKNGTFTPNSDITIHGTKPGKDGKSVGRTEVAHIYSGLATAADYVFGISDFIPVVDLVDGVWQDGEITSPGEVQYYRFPVMAGTSYMLWWNREATGQYYEGINGVTVHREYRIRPDTNSARYE
jgi:hypothetical protein